VGEVQGFVWRTDRPLQTLHAVDMSHREWHRADNGSCALYTARKRWVVCGCELWTFSYVALDCGLGSGMWATFGARLI
jgi:hypothetical protein